MARDDKGAPASGAPRCPFTADDGAFLLQQARCAGQVGDEARRRHFLQLAAKVGDLLGQLPDWPRHCDGPMAADAAPGRFVCAWCGAIESHPTAGRG